MKFEILSKIVHCFIQGLLHHWSIWSGNRVLGKFLLRKFHLGKFHLENSSYGKFLLRCFGDTLFRSWLASLAVGLRTLVSQVRAQRHSRIACYIVFFHRRNFPGATFLGGIFLGGIYRSRRRHIRVISLDD